MTHNRVAAGLNGFDAKRIVRERLNFHVVSLWRMQSVMASKISRVSLKELLILTSANMSVAPA